MYRQISRFLAVAVLLAFCLQASAQTDPFALLFEDGPSVDAGADDRPGEDDVRFIGLRLGALKLDGAATAYAREAGLCLVAKELLHALEAPVSVTVSGAEGWFIAPHRTVSVDVAIATAILNGSTRIDLQGHLYETQDGWCLTETAWSRLLPIDFAYDPVSMTLGMDPREQLPLEARLEREAIRARLDRSQGVGGPDYREIDNPYRWLGFPTADISVELRADSAGAAPASGSLELGGDVLWTTARLRTVQAVGGETALRLSFERVFEPEASGWQPKQLRFGDVTGPGQPLLARSASGRGLLVTNRPAYTASVFDVTDIRGALPPGWEAELYRDTQLVDFVTGPDEQGEYVFRDVAIRPGYNRYQVRLFGPHGETDLRDVRLFAGEEMHPENEVRYELALMEEGIALDGKPTGRRQAVASGSIGMGFSQTLSGQVDLRVAGDGSLAATTSAHFARGSTQGVLRLAGSGSGGPAFEASAAHRFENRDGLTARYVWFGDGELIPESETAGVRQRLSLQHDTRLRLPGREVPLQSDLVWEENAAGGRRLGATARIASALMGWRWTHLAGYEQVTSAGTRSQSFSGSLNASRRLGGMRLRGAVAYTPGPEPAIDSLDFAVQRRVGRSGFAQFGLLRDMTSGRSQATAGLSRTHGNLTLSATGSLDARGDWSAGLRLATALYFDDRKRRYRSAPAGLSQTGAIRAHVFDDIDEDGQLGDGDRALPGARFILDRTLRGEESQGDGGAILAGVDVHRPLDMELSLGSLDDPFLQPAEPGLAVRVRPGQVVDVDFPLSLSGEVEATVVLMNGATAVPVSGVRVEAVNRTGEVVAAARSEYDGYVYITALPMGAFELRIAPDALDRIGGSAQPAEIRLSRAAPTASGIEFRIDQSAGKASTNG